MLPLQQGNQPVDKASKIGRSEADEQHPGMMLRNPHLGWLGDCAVPDTIVFDSVDAKKWRVVDAIAKPFGTGSGKGDDCCGRVVIPLSRRRGSNTACKDTVVELGNAEADGIEESGHGDVWREMGQV